MKVVILTMLQGALLSTLMREGSGKLTADQAAFLLQTNIQSIGKAALALSAMGLLHREGDGTMWPDPKAHEQMVARVQRSVARNEKALRALRRLEEPFRSLGLRRRDLYGYMGNHAAAISILTGQPFMLATQPPN